MQLFLAFLPGMFFFRAFPVKTIVKEGQVAYQIRWCALGNVYGEYLSLKSMRENPLHAHVHTV